MIAKIEQDQFYDSSAGSDAGSIGATFPLHTDTPATDISDYVGFKAYPYK